MGYAIRFIDRDTRLDGRVVLVSRENALRFVSELKYRLHIKEISWTTESRWDFFLGSSSLAFQSYGSTGTSANNAVLVEDMASGQWKETSKRRGRSFSASIVAMFKWLTGGRTNDRKRTRVDS